MKNGGKSTLPVATYGYRIGKVLITPGCGQERYGVVSAPPPASGFGYIQEPAVSPFLAVSYCPQAKLINRTISRGRPTRKPIIQHAPPLLPRFTVHPIHGMDFGTQARLSFLLK